MFCYVMLGYVCNVCTYVWMYACMHVCNVMLCNVMLCYVKLCMYVM